MSQRPFAVAAALAPKSVAIIGASDNPNKVGGRPVDYLKRFGFRGHIYPINPARDALGLPLAKLSDRTKEKLREALASFAAVGNPIDLTAAILGNKEVFGRDRQAGSARGLGQHPGFLPDDNVLEPVGHIEMSLLGKLIDGTRAKELGLNYLVEKNEVLPKALEVALEFSELPANALKLTKERFRKLTQAAFDDACEAVVRYHTKEYATGEPQKIMRGFLEARAKKRKPE